MPYADGSIAAAIDRLSATLANGPDFLTWSNVILSVASVCATVVGVKVAAVALRFSKQQSAAAERSVEVSSQAIEEEVRSERHSRNLDALLYCQSAYKAIEAERLKFRWADENEKANLKGGQIESLFRTYWTLKSDQLDYWLSGYVDYDTFLTWNVSTVRHFINSRSEHFFVESFLYGWIRYGRPYHLSMNPLFVRFTDALHHKFKDVRDISDDDVLKILDIIMEVDVINLEKDSKGRVIRRRYGAPENVERYRDDLVELQGNMRSLLKRHLPESYDMQEHGNNLERDHRLKSNISPQKIS